MALSTLRLNLRLWFALSPCYIAFYAAAQQQFLQFDKTYGGPNEEICAGMIPGSDGGYLLVGTTGSYGPGASDVSRNGYVVKVDSNGNPEWQFALGGAGQDFFADAARTSEGDYLVIGQRIQDENMLLTRVGPGGDVLWTKDIGTDERSESASRILALAQNQFVVVGSRDNNVIVLWIDADGGIQQTTEFACAPEIRATDVVLGADGTLLISGGYTSTPQQHAMLLKVGMDGTLVWGRIYQQLEHSTYHQGLVPTTDGGCITAGSGGDSYASLTRIDAVGNVLWRRGFAGAYSNQCRDLIQYGPDRLVTTVYMSSIGVLQAPSALLLLDTLGNPVDQVVFGPTADELYSLPNAINLDSTGGCYIAGKLISDNTPEDMRLTRIPVNEDLIDEPCSSLELTLLEMTMPPVTFGPMITTLEPPVFTTATLNWSPVAVAGSNTICANVGIGDAPISAPAHCFPNPASDVLFFYLPIGSRPVKATVYDATGRRLSEELLRTESGVAVEHLAPGIYHCRIDCEHGVIFTLPFVAE